MPRIQKKRKGPYVQNTSGYTKKWKRDTQKNKNKISICYTPLHKPDIMRVALNFTVSASTGIITNGRDFVYRGNSCFDPDFAVGGTQPLAFDQWSALYTRYRVLASKCTFKVKNVTGITGSGQMMVLVPLVTNSAVTNRELLAEQRYAKTRMVGDSDGMDVAVLECYMDTASVRGVPKEAIRIDSNYSALTSADPNLQWYWHCGCYDASNSLAETAFNFIVQITYYVEFFEGSTLNRS